MNNGGFREIQMVKTFQSDFLWRCIICRDVGNWKQKLSANSNGQNFWLRSMCEAHDISRRSKMNKGSSREIQMVIAFHSDLRFRRIIYRDARNWTRMVSDNSNSHNFWLGCMCEAHDILRRSKKNNGSFRKIQMVITFQSDVRLRFIICQDTRNWTPKLSANSNNHNYWLGCMCEAHDISRC